VQKKNDDSDVPQIPGVDSQVGLKFLAGNVKLYGKILLKFAKANQDFAAEFKSLERDVDLTAQERLAHTLKSTSGSIGAIEIQGLAKELESACKNKTPLDELVQSISKKLNPIAETILSYFESENVPQASKQSSDLTEHSSDLSEIIELCETYDTDAIRIIEELIDKLNGNSSTASLKEAYQAMQNYDFDKASKLIKTLLPE